MMFMRAIGKGRRAILGGLVVLAVGLFWLSAEEPPATVNPQLVSIQQLPDLGGMCQWPDSSVSGLAALENETNLFAALHGKSVYAAAQDGGTTADVTRPPVRTIRDAYPI